jgi:hypothetical protein
VPEFVKSADAGFVENVCFNRGVFVGYFENEDKAIEWLNSK